MSTLHVIKKQGLSPEFVTYNILIHRLWSAGEKSIALQVGPRVCVSYHLEFACVHCSTSMPLLMSIVADFMLEIPAVQWSAKAGAYREDSHPSARVKDTDHAPACV